jgi:hydrogenase expression/formation protein HypD
LDEVYGSRRLKTVRHLLESIAGHARTIGRPVQIMEVCGTHTVALRRTGVLSLLPDGVRLVSGPGCPVCVTPASYIENALRLIEEEDAVIATFGDMLKVPDRFGSSLSSYMGTDRVKIIYSPWELVEYAETAVRDIVFLGIGFETTIPAIATVFLEAFKKSISNLFLYPAFKLVPPALRALLGDDSFSIDGFLLPGHVSVIIGRKVYGFLCGEFRVPGVITGFEAEDLLAGIEALLGLIAGGECRVVNAYSRVVREEGNPKAVEVIRTLFEPADSLWRGFGYIPASGMNLKAEYEGIDAEKRFGIPPPVNTDPGTCLCGSIIQGKALPPDCPLFGSGCNPDRPSGPCMVSSEGACAAWFQYGDADTMERSWTGR